VNHGFLRAADGTITTYEAPGAAFSSVAIDPSGNVVGIVFTNVALDDFFLRSTDGTITFLSTPGGVIFDVAGIDSQCVIAGTYEDISNGTLHGFLRLPPAAAAASATAATACH
jgi:hypothetical protein